MNSRARRYLALPLVATLSAIALTGCVSPDGRLSSDATQRPSATLP